MIFRSLILYFICFFPFVLFAQKQDNVWTFGYHNGLDFNAGEPVFIESASNSWGPTASISDENGQLLFYTDGVNIYQADGSIMKNGKLNSSPKGSIVLLKFVILKSMYNKNQYYIFENNKYNLFYHIVDLSANNGQGEVIEKRIFLNNNINDIAINKGSDCFHYWLLAKSETDTTFFAYKINMKGIASPVTSQGSAYNSPLLAPMIFTPDGSQLIHIRMTITRLNTNPYYQYDIHGFEIYDFNSENGQLQLKQFISEAYTSFSWNHFASLCFSPSGQRFYTAIFNSDNLDVSINRTLYQYDFSLLPDSIAFKNSKAIINAHPFSYNFYMRLASNGKIYLSSGVHHGNIGEYRYSSEYLSCINNPNAIGVACDFEEAALLFPDSTVFPAHTVNSKSPPYGFYGFSLPDITIPQNHQIVQTAPQFNFLCPQVGKTISYADDAYDKIVWFDDTEGDTYHFSIPGIYWVYKFKDCQLTIDTLVMETSEMHLQEHYLNLCRIAHPTYDLKVQTNLPGTITWSTGAVDTTTITVTESGRYVVTFQNECGVFRDTAIVQFMEDCDCKPFIPNAFSPNGDGLNDVFQVKNICPTEKFELYIYNRVGQRVFKSYSIQDTWDGSYNGKPLPNETYFYYLNYESVNGLQYRLRGDILLLR